MYRVSGTDEGVGFGRLGDLPVVEGVHVLLLRHEAVRRGHLRDPPATEEMGELLLDRPIWLAVEIDVEIRAVIGETPGPFDRSSAFVNLEAKARPP
jgi:hypothetical protein